MRMPTMYLWILTIVFYCPPVFAEGNEVVKETGVKVFIREHPQTGKPFVSLRAYTNTADPFKGFVKREVRPDYRMLDANVKPGDVRYDGPTSDRRKVYAFAATMMTLGVAGGIVTAALPATAAAGAGAGGTGLLGAGTAVVVTGTAATIVAESHIKPGEEHYIHDAKSVSAAGVPSKVSFKEVLREIDARDASLKEGV